MMIKNSKLTFSFVKHANFHALRNMPTYASLIWPPVIFFNIMILYLTGRRVLPKDDIKNEI